MVMNKDLIEQALILGVALDAMAQEEVYEEMYFESPIEEEDFELKPFKLTRTFTIESAED